MMSTASIRNRNSSSTISTTGLPDSTRPIRPTPCAYAISAGCCFRSPLGFPSTSQPFLQDDTGAPVAGAAEECQSSSGALRRAEILSKAAGSIGAVAFSRTGDPMIGEFGDAQLLRKFGDVPDDLSGL
jgi:hypothetical protein